MTETERIGQFVKQCRKELHMTQEELAQKVGYKARVSINNIERGLCDIPPQKIQTFATVLNCDINDLVPHANVQTHGEIEFRNCIMCKYWREIDEGEHCRQCIYLDKDAFESEMLIDFLKELSHDDIKKALKRLMERKLKKEDFEVNGIFYKIKRSEK